MLTPLKFISSKGFTLAELLIVLSVLGIIAAFTIPKIIAQNQEVTKKAIFREIISNVSVVQRKGMLRRDLMPANFNLYFQSHLNASRTCDTDSNAQGCWNDSIQGTDNETDEPGYVWYSGAYVVGFNDCCDISAMGFGTQGWGNVVLIDWNGLAGPNQRGQDQLGIFICFSDVDCDFFGNTYFSGQIAPDRSVPEHIELFNQTFMVQ